ncbi:MAG TPA: ImmA/IrrE family metallo-endopeptidase [Candidatus Tripitaka californicus]|uniref:ImmA/IrrE family metallo-endopeptidase n=1 Tax=Candidatus Tripitaka californicus TaxID=3367616 RepID=UPI0040294B74|nr:ImmA/IrrE family metallo-endopeptidase [Planctomycetota bacterium]
MLQPSGGGDIPYKWQESGRMVPDIAALAEQEARALLERMDIHAPPVDAYLIARKLGLTVQIDPHLKTRGYSRTRWDLGTIIVGSKNPNKSERKQFTIAHEIGEVSLKGRVEEAHLEEASNLMAINLLLPGEWFKRDAEVSDFDLLRLKKTYSTASHELIAFRMLEFRPMIVTIFDNGRLYKRKSSYPFTVRPSYLLESQCLKEVTTSGAEVSLKDEEISVVGWPIFREDWKRVILRTEL